MYTYRKIFLQALRVTVQHPGLWFFGFFVALLGGGGEIGVLLSGYGFSQNDIIGSFINGLAEGGLFSMAGLRGLTTVLLTHPGYLVVAVLIGVAALALAILTIWLITISQSAVISQSIEISHSKSFKWSQGMQAGVVNFWPVLGLNVAIRIFEWLIIVGFTLLMLTPFLWLTRLAEAFGYIAIALMFVVAMVVKYAMCGVILRGWKLLPSFVDGFHLLRRNLVTTFEVAFILFVTYLLVNMFLLLIMQLIFVFAIKAFATFLFGQIILVALLLGFFVWLEILLAIFHWATWAIVFELLTSKKALLESFIRRTWNYVRS